MVAAYHQVHDYTCCHLQADYLESGISSSPLHSVMNMSTFTFTLSYDPSTLLPECNSLSRLIADTGEPYVPV